MKKGLAALLVVVALLAVVVVFGVRIIQGPEVPQGSSDLRFLDVSPDWRHETDLESALPFMAAAMVDVDGDGVDEIFVGGGVGQADALFRYSNGRFVRDRRTDDFSKSGEAPTYGAASLDITGDGRTDLFVARGDGVWLFENGSDGFEGRKVGVEFAENTAPLGVAIGDVDGDGWADLYVSGYIKLAYVEGETIFNEDYGGYSYLLINNGDNTWRDGSREWGVWRQHNTFTAAFLDLDRDRDHDLVVAQDTGRVEVYENQGATFRLLPPVPEFSYPMGLGFGDYDNDGEIDLYLSNVGRTLPRALLRGDLRSDQVLNMNYILMRNGGGMRFSDQAAETGAAEHGFGWGTVVHDMDLDGRQDLIVAQNYARFPGVDIFEPYNGRLLLQGADGRFVPVEEVTKAANPFFGMTPLVSDFDGNGYPDLVWANLTGPLRVLMSEGGTNHWLAVRLPDSVSSLGAIVRAELPGGHLLNDQYAVGEGLGSDQTPVLFFGLAEKSRVERVTVDFTDGSSFVAEDPPIDGVLDVRGRVQ